VPGRPERVAADCKIRRRSFGADATRFGHEQVEFILVDARGRRVRTALKMTSRDRSEHWSRSLEKDTSRPRDRQAGATAVLWPRLRSTERDQCSDRSRRVILSAVRDTDVLARVDENEFYLLMPERWRRRPKLPRVSCSRLLLARSPGTSGVPPASRCVSTYPHDGTDLSKLLRAAEATRGRLRARRSCGP